MVSSTCPSPRMPNKFKGKKSNFTVACDGPHTSQAERTSISHGANGSPRRWSDAAKNSTLLKCFGMTHSQN